jgi:hypothetical protein
MGNILLHNPWIQFYLLYVTALSVAFIWDYLRNAARQNAPQPVLRQRPRADKEVETVRGTHRLRAPTDPCAVLNSRNRREYHVVSP